MIFIDNYYNSQLFPIFAAIGGLLFSIPIKMFWDSYKSPNLIILADPELRQITLYDRPYHGTTYVANRIIVRNTGRTAATNCKGYIIHHSDQLYKERVCWSTFEREIVTINKNDDERLDYCAFNQSSETTTGLGRFPAVSVPTEKGWDTPRALHDKALTDKYEVLITSDNANQAKRSIALDTRAKKIIIS